MARTRTKQTDVTPHRDAYRILEGWPWARSLRRARSGNATIMVTCVTPPTRMPGVTLREIAAAQPLPGVTAQEAVNAIDDAMRAIGDTCPERGHGAVNKRPGKAGVRPLLGLTMRERLAKGRIKNAIAKSVLRRSESSALSLSNRWGIV